MSHILDKIDTVYPFPPKPVPLSDAQKQAHIANIKKLLQEKDAVLIAHYYTDPEIQALAEATGGFVGDSLEMAKFGNRHSASTLIIAGVRFMGESAKILTPEKRILMPTLEAECSLDLGCPADKFTEFCDVKLAPEPITVSTLLNPKAVANFFEESLEKLIVCDVLSVLLNVILLV